MKKKFGNILSLLLISVLLFSSFSNQNEVNAVTETRYMQALTPTVNGLTAYGLGTGQTSSGTSTFLNVSGSGTLTASWGIRVWKRSSSGTETEITSGTPVAQVSRTSAGSGIQSNTWSPPLTSLATTDSIVTRVYFQVGTSGWVQPVGLQTNFTTGQLGNTQLDNVTWTVYYFTEYTNYNTGPPSGRWTQGEYLWGISSWNSRIENFSYSSPVLTVGTEGTQRITLHPGSSDENLGGAFTFIRDTSTTSVTSIKITQTGSVTDANLTDIVLFYKQEATCSTTIPVDATQFNSTPGTFSSGTTTVTGSMSVGTSQICVYVRLDVGSGASATETIDFEITNPSTDVVVSSGAITPATAVAINGTTTITVGNLSLVIVDDSDLIVTDPSVSFTSTTFDFDLQQTTGTMGSSTQRIKIGNFTANHTWSLSIAATNGNTSRWESGSNDYGHNGSSTDGRLQVDPSVATLTPISGCSNTGLSLQSSAYFSQGVIDSINLVSAGATSETDCFWYLTGVGLTQDIPGAQSGGDYSISMTLTLL